MNYKVCKILILFLIFISFENLYAQNSASIFDEGAEEEIRPEEITDDLRMWAENTALKLKKVLKEAKKYTSFEKRKVLLEAIRSSVTEAQGKRELLLMRFTLNRVLKLEALFEDHHDTLVVNYVLLPLIKQAIFLYEKADLPFLEANKGKTDMLEPPAYAAFTKENIGYLLTVSNMNKSYVNQFNVLKLALVWVAKDLLRSTATRRNPVNSGLILDFQDLIQKLENLPQNEINFKVNNMLRETLLEARDKLVLETNAPEMKSPIDVASVDTSDKRSQFFPGRFSDSSSLSIFPDGGILECRAYTIGPLFMHYTATRRNYKVITCDGPSNEKYYVELFGVGVGAYYSKEMFSINYAGYGDIEGSYYGPRIGAGLLVGANTGIFTNGRMFVTITGVSLSIGAVASISKIQIIKKETAEKMSSPENIKTQNATVSLDEIIMIAKSSPYSGTCNTILVEWFNKNYWRLTFTELQILMSECPYNSTSDYMLWTWTKYKN